MADAIHKAVATLDPTCTWSPDRDATALEALNRTPAMGKTEVGGVLYRNAEGNYCYSIPVGNQNDRHFHLQAQIPAGLTLDGLYHVHPGAEQSSLFSADDVDMMHKLKVASYIKDSLTSGVVKRLDPSYQGARPTLGTVVPDPSKIIQASNP